MSEAIDPIQEKRQAALARLRGRRGEARQPIFDSRREQEEDRLYVVAKAYQSLRTPGAEEDEDEEDIGAALLPPIDAGDEPPLTPDDLELHPEVPMLEEHLSVTAAEVSEASNELPRVAKARKALQQRDKTADDAFAKWRSLMQGRRERQQNPGAEPTKPVGLPHNERRQLFSDLLTVDFLEHTRLWISGSPDNIDLSSTPLEEVERTYSQALYRRKVLEALEQMNEQEIDALTAYLRVVRSHSLPTA